MRAIYLWLAVFLVIVGTGALVLVPFFLFEAALFEFAETIVLSDRSPWFLGGILSALLVSDLFLPVPSSLISTAGGGEQD